jgi:hypothetical protein
VLRSKYGIGLNVVSITNSQQMLLAKDPIELATWPEALMEQVRSAAARSTPPPWPPPLHTLAPARRAWTPAWAC